MSESDQNSGSNKFDSFAAKVRDQDRKWNQAIQESVSAQLAREKRFRWMIPVLGGAVLLYFLSLAFTDRGTFKESADILITGLKKLVVAIALWSVLIWAYFRMSERNKKKVQMIGAGLFVVLVVMIVVYLRGAVGMVYRLDGQGSGSFWTVTRVFQILGEIFLSVFLLVGRKRLLARGIGRFLVYITEGAFLYLFITLVGQIVFQMDMLLIYKMVLSRGVLFLPFFFPLAGYIALRRIFSLE